jgi:glycosyltransferase involved in cell wall biosynthesis
MRVGFLCNEYPRICATHGGIGAMVETMAHGLVAAGHQACVYALGERDETINDDGVEVVVVARRGNVLGTIVNLRRRLRHELRCGHVEVVESPESDCHCLPWGRGGVVRMNGGHHFWCATLPQRSRPVRLLLEQIGIRQVHGLSAVSTYAASVTRKAMRLGNRAIEILPNPVDTELFTPQPESVVPYQVFFAGSVVAKKGIRELCLAMTSVMQRHPQARLLVAGRDGRGPAGEPSFQKVIEQALDSETLSHIHFLGHCSRSEIRRQMASAAVCVFPSFMETQGIVIAEAMACGRPVVVTERGPGPEVMGEDGGCGLLVDPADPSAIANAICEILGTPERATEMGSRGRQRAVSRYSLEALLEKNLEFYSRHQVGHAG